MIFKTQKQIEKEIEIEEQAIKDIQKSIDNSISYNKDRLSVLINAQKEHKYIILERLQALLQQNKDFIEMIDKLIKIKTEERVLWEHNLLRSGKSIHQKGYFKNPDFQIQANAMIYVLEELKSSIIGSEEKK